MNLKDKIKERAAQIHPLIVANRRHLHANPELSFEEYETQKFVEGKLKEMGISDVKRIAGTGLTAIIEGFEDNGKLTALRGDMDALPIHEANKTEYVSTKPGVMHACGHDVHTSSLLGAAQILHETRDQWKGRIKLVFQPGEEKAPGGAAIMIKEGILKNPEVGNILGQHVMPLLPVGTVGFRPGLYMASADEIFMTVKGKGGHGAMPQMNIDPVLITSHIIVALQQIVSRNGHPAVPSVLSFGRVIADGATNVIPNSVEVEGTFRTMDEKWRAEAKEKIMKMAQGIAESMGGSCEINIVHGYPYLQNDPDLTAKVRAFAEEYMGTENVKDLDLWMAAEDFAYYSQEIPACFYRLGTRNEEKGIISSVHTPTFDIDEEALKIGAGLMAWLAVKELGN